MPFPYVIKFGRALKGMLLSSFSMRHNNPHEASKPLTKLGDLTVWRTSTTEPTRGDGIIWTYLKDATRYIPLFAKPGTFILQLDNLLETGLDGQYASELSYSSHTHYRAL